MYVLPKEVLDKYVCSECKRSGLKLWRDSHYSNPKWCADCITKGTYKVDEFGMYLSEYGWTDQIKPPEGCSKLPCVPAPDGLTWGYTSVPQEACIWWQCLPTYLE